MDTKVFKFGGASIANHDLIKNVRSIIESYGDSQIVIVISAMGKTTNALELVVQSYIDTKGGSIPSSLMEQIIEDHIVHARSLGIDTDLLLSKFQNYISESQELLKIIDISDHAAIYAQIVSLGELFSTTMVEMYLSHTEMKSTWLDVRTVIKSDDNYKDATVNYNSSVLNIRERTQVLFKEKQYIVTQGFIASTPMAYTTTLGREGSDYTAAIFAYAMDAGQLTIWKDVPGILTADPRRFDNVELLPKLSYSEAIEMTYYGATVIHPKTIRPIQNKSIQLHVRSYLNPKDGGTVISDQGLPNYPPIVVVQDNRLMIQITTKDFTFIAENHLSIIFSTLNAHRIKMSVMRNSAISFTLIVKDPGKDRLKKFTDALGDNFSFDVFDKLQLITIRYAQAPLIEALTKNKVILFEERMKSTIQLVVRPALELKEKEV
ncbi:aspartate kinase [Saprospiraceae bacterium]|nr:aspartate kinase [Saprospiraceae bacterium]